MTLSNEKFNDMLTCHKGLESQISQLANEFKEFTNLSSLTSQSLDLKSPMNAIVTRSGRVLKSEISKKSDIKDSHSNGQIENEGEENTLVEEVNNKQVEKVKEREREVYKPKLPYPQKFNRHNLDKQFGKFIEMLRQLHLTLPFTDVIEQMPNYAKFLKEILSGNRTCGASVSITPYSIYQRLEKGELLPTNITLQLVDRSIRIPRGKVEDVPLRVGKFIIPVDFVVLDIDEDSTIPIILGRPFLATSGALIDVKSAKISLKIGDKGVEFDLNESMKYPSSSLENCMRVEILDNLVHSMHDHLLTTNDPLECVLLNKEKIGAPSKDMALYENFLDGSVEGSDEQICMKILI
ncbi:uncharacterized protein LOC110701101 [Chenopodium quinoa]|uniref:uncharacterized protein LOC110701101 n=1 Tax=Chenopodium quinoa TaxID=63459 RepID=UPI000B7852DF|nr:uncharacterized protein LOC110701101 [Chenopodium quinoa]